MEMLANILNKIYQLILGKIESEKEISDGSTRIPYQEFTYTIAAGDRVEIFQVFNYFRVLSQTASTTLSIRLGQNGLETPFTGVGVGLQCEDIFSRLTLINTSGISMTITIAVAYGSVNDDRLSVTSGLSITSVVPGTGATNLGKSEGVAHVTGDTGVAAWTVRNDSLSSTWGGVNQGYNPISTDLKGAVYTCAAKRVISTSQTTVSTTAVLLVTAAAGNDQVIIDSGSDDLYIGATSGVTTANGFLVRSGTTIAINTVGNVYGIRATAGSLPAYVLLGQN